MIEIEEIKKVLKVFPYRTSHPSHNILKLQRNMFDSFQEKLAKMAHTYSDNHQGFLISGRFIINEKYVTALYVFFSDLHIYFSTDYKEEES